MLKKHFYIKGALFAALLLIFQSCSSSCRQWTYDEVCTNCPYYNSKRLVLYPDNQFRGLELVFLRTYSGQRAYINIFSLALPMDSNDPHKTQICISCEISSYDLYAERLEGGQRLLLSDEAAELIISNLLECKTVTISVGRYKSEIIPRGFSEAYRNFISD